MNTENSHSCPLHFQNRSRVKLPRQVGCKLGSKRHGCLEPRFLSLSLWNLSSIGGPQTSMKQRGDFSWTRCRLCTRSWPNVYIDDSWHFLLILSTPLINWALYQWIRSEHRLANSDGPSRVITSQGKMVDAMGFHMEWAERRINKPTAAHNGAGSPAFCHYLQIRLIHGSELVIARWDRTKTL